MSKTVKRVTTVMMIGLVALLGAKAEAHTRWVGGRPYVCLVCDNDAMLTEVPPDLKDITKKPKKLPAPGVAELVVKTTEVTLTCPDLTTVTLKGKEGEATLIAETPSNLWTYDSTAETATLQFVISDELFGTLGFCGGAIPIEAITDKMSAKYKAYACTGTGKKPDCSTRVLLTIMRLNNCTVKPDAPPNTLYTCDKPIFEHVHPTPTK